MLKRGPINRIYGFKGLNTMKSLKMKMSVGLILCFSFIQLHDTSLVDKINNAIDPGQVYNRQS